MAGRYHRTANNANGAKSISGASVLRVALEAGDCFENVLAAIDPEIGVRQYNFDDFAGTHQREVRSVVDSLFALRERPDVGTHIES